MFFKSALFILCVIASVSGHKYEQVLLTDVQVLTLYHGAYSTGRRAPPVPQVRCVGGSAAKSAYHPKVVQCYNRGTDGQAVQWECKADLDNAVRFGTINVYCEGYNYPDDPYILKGSCGLEYQLDYVDGKKGHAKDDNITGGSLIIFVVICVAVYVVYASCLRSDDERRRTGGDSRFPPGGGPPPPYDDRPSGPPGDQPPPYGFRSDHFPGKQGATSGAYQQQQQQQRYGANYNAGGNAGGNQGGPGFWTGLGTGGILGYMMGRNTGDNTRHSYGSGHTYSSPTYSDHGGSSSSGYFGQSSSSSSSTRTDGSSGLGTRTASGFGETRRR